MQQEKGNLSINSENFLPIIKKWLYTDKDIFIRELVSNGCDAVTKLKKLQAMGQAENVPAEESFSVHVILNKKDKTLQFEDNGIGMTADEIKKYINQIAFSGANDFLAKYGESTDKNNEIIGHFGLGFYSAFMVADQVEINSLSYQEGAVAAKWICDGGIEYEMEEGSRQNRGTTITLHLGEDGKEFLEESALYGALRKYCSFMPVEIYVDVIEEKEDSKEDGSEEEKETEVTAEPEKKPLNDTNPLWLKQPKDCTDEEYKEFYHKVFFDLNDPLLWIHLNMDYPFRLKGILYFPKMNNDMEVLEGEVKLYSNQVYIADNIKEVIPEFLLILKGVLDCPDLPLNVSRSALQNDGYAAKMSSYITKKVADKINAMFKNNREEYEGIFDDLSLFIKYGCIKEDKFYDKVKDSLLFYTTDGVYRTMEEYLEKNKDKSPGKMFYVTDEKQQIQYIQMFKDQGMEAVILPGTINTALINFLDYKESGKLQMERIDADLSDTLKDSQEETEESKKENEAQNQEFQNLFRTILGKNELLVKGENLKAKNISAVMLVSEESRRLEEMRQMYKNQPSMLAMFGDRKPEETLVLNKNNKLIQLLAQLKGQEGKQEQVDLICRQVYDLALMGQKALEPEEMTQFIDRSNQILEKLLELENK